MLIVGSSALNFHFPELQRQVKDIDVIGYQDDIDFLIKTLSPEKVRHTENLTTLIGIKYKSKIFHTDNVEVLNATNSESLKQYLSLENKQEISFASPQILLSLKKSHIHFPIKFHKHIKDYNFLIDTLKEDKLHTITKINFKETELRYGKLKTPSLKKSTRKFFDQSEGYVTYFYVHDDIHKVMSHYDRPIYEDMQTNSESAWCQKEIWNNFSFEKKAKCVLEEAYVIALERKIIPMLNGVGDIISSKKAFEWSMMRICTNLCSGWFRQFATDNYLKIQDYYNPNYVSIFLDAETQGKIKKINLK